MNPDPKPQLGQAAIEANIDYWSSQLDRLDQQRALIQEQLQYWQGQQTSLKNHELDQG